MHAGTGLFVGVINGSALPFMNASLQQLIRYEFGGKPLPVTDKLPLLPTAGPCPGCGRPRSFEMQLLPNCVGVLRLAQPAASATDASSAPAMFSEPVEFGTAIIATCEDDCGLDQLADNHVAYTEESILVQPDPEAVELLSKTIAS